MPIHKLKLVSRRDVARATVEFIFEKPAGLTFIPGQYAGFTLINPEETDASGITRRFSLSSTPDDEHIAITLRMQNSAYKRVLNTMNIGMKLNLHDPLKHLHQDNTKTCCIHCRRHRYYAIL